MKTLLSLLAVCVLLSACGGGSSSNAVAEVAPAPVAPVADSFTSDVTRVVAVASDTAEPAALDATAPTISESAEPVPVT